MKWTKTEDIEFEIESLPDEVYSVLVPHVCEGIETTFWWDGTIGFHHEWDSEKQFQRCRPLTDLVRESIEQGLEASQIEKMLSELEKSAGLLRSALAQNALAQADAACGVSPGAMGSAAMLRSTEKIGQK